jgi:hypothetical protein
MKLEIRCFALIYSARGRRKVTHGGGGSGRYLSMPAVCSARPSSEWLTRIPASRQKPYSLQLEIGNCDIEWTCEDHIDFIVLQVAQMCYKGNVLSSKCG